MSTRVVIAEDDVFFREGIARLLVEADFEVVGQAGDAEEFLRKALAHRPDVVVVDIEMPRDVAPTGCGPLKSSALDIRQPACSCFPAITRMVMRWISSARARRVSATCSRTELGMSRRLPRRSPAGGGRNGA